MTWVQVTAPAEQPISLDEVKEHLKVVVDEEDGLIQTYIGAATQYAESATRRSIITRSYDYFADAFPTCGWFELPRPVLTSVTSVKYYDESDTQQTLAASKYYVDIKREPGRIQLKATEQWPVTIVRPNAVEVRYVAGYADKDAVPSDIKTAMFLMIGHWFENREAVVVGPTGLRVKEVPLSTDILLNNNRVMGFPDA